MKTLWIRKPAMLGVTLSITLAAALAGCGGAATKSSDAVAATDPTAVAASKSAAAPTTSASPATTATSASSSSTAPVKAEGWGTLKGQVIWSWRQPSSSSKILSKRARRQRTRHLRREELRSSPSV